MHVYVLPMLVLLFYFEWKRLKHSVLLCVSVRTVKSEKGTTSWLAYNTRARRWQRHRTVFIFLPFMFVLFWTRLKRKIIQTFFVVFLFIHLARHTIHTAHTVKCARTQRYRHTHTYGSTYTHTHQYNRMVWITTQRSTEHCYIYTHTWLHKLYSFVLCISMLVCRSRCCCLKCTAADRRKGKDIL